jgi:hypothetical protein
MRGKKSYNIRNIEAHLNNYQNKSNSFENNNSIPVSSNMFFNTRVNNINNSLNLLQFSEQQRQNEFINAKFGVSKYASNLVSGRMFKKI